MYIKLSKANILIGLSALCLFTVLLPLGAMAADNAKPAVTIPDDAEIVRLVAQVSEVNGSESTMNIAENVVLVARYQSAGEIHQTVLLDAKKNAITIYAFEKGQLVKLMGYRLSDGRVIAESIVKKVKKSK